MTNVTETYSITFESFQAGADPTIEDRNQRLPLDEAVIANKPGLSYLWFRCQTCLSSLRNTWHSAVSWSEFKRASLSSIDHRCSSRSRRMSEDLARRRYGSEHHRSHSHHSITRGVCRLTCWPRHFARWISIFSVRSLKLSTARLLVSYGADQNIANNRGETPITIAEYLQPDQQQSFLNILVRK